jgi:hypothetical protein
METWVTDEQLYDAADRCARKLIEMCADATGDPHTTPPGSLPRTIAGSLRLDAEDFMLFDPARLDEYARILAIAKATGSNPHAYADFEETKNHLINWTGDAAIAFKRQVDLMTEFCDLQQFNILQALLGLLATGQLAVRARADYLELAEATIAAAQREIGEQAKREATAVVSIAGEIVDAVLNLEPGRLLNGAISIFVKIGGESGKYVIEGADADVVIGNYVRARTELARFYDQELRTLGKRLQERIDEVLRDGQPLREPLPAYCQVDSPDFSYERFQSTRGGELAPITPVVEEERRKYVEEKKVADTEIDRRLNPDKGAI